LAPLYSDTARATEADPSSVLPKNRCVPAIKLPVLHRKWITFKFFEFPPNRAVLSPEVGQLLLESYVVFAQQFNFPFLLLVPSGFNCKFDLMRAKLQ
jgi:hypothetical protein